MSRKENFISRSYCQITVRVQALFTNSIPVEMPAVEAMESLSYFRGCSKRGGLQLERSGQRTAYRRR